MILHISRRSFIKVSGVASAAAWSVLLAGCATAPGSQADADALLARAKAYWALSQANDNVSAWPYEDVSLDPRWTLQSYLQRGGAAYDAVAVHGVASISGDEGHVDVDITFSLPSLKIKKHKMPIKDAWRRIDGRWYHVLQQGSMFQSK